MFSLLLPLVLALGPVDYSGHWTLDLQRSVGLPPYYARVKSHTLDITQSTTSLEVDVDVDFGGSAPDHLHFSYPLDGHIAKTESMIRTGQGQQAVPTTLQATVADDGSVHIVIARTITMPDRTFTGTTTEDWHLGADGRTLTVKRTDETPRGPMNAEMVFLKTN